MPRLHPVIRVFASGQTDPPAGWYSHAFGTRMPTVTLLGSGRAAFTAATAGARPKTG